MEMPPILREAKTRVKRALRVTTDSSGACLISIMLKIYPRESTAPDRLKCTSMYAIILNPLPSKQDSLTNRSDTGGLQ